MAKTETIFYCKSCGNESPRWLGKCPGCDQWNTYEEASALTKAGKADNGGANLSNSVSSALFSKDQVNPEPITKLTFNEEDRLSTGIGELDRVLGGGIVPGSVVLLSGDPGIGKSTLALQIAHELSAGDGENKGIKVLYASGEESAKQIRLRSERLGTLNENLYVFPENNLNKITLAVEKERPEFLVIDSIQTVYREDITASAGSVSQVRESAAYLVRLAKTLNLPVLIVGHVTKDGSIAGPKLLEHIVDTVLYFEGEEHRQARILRATKNRFGSTNEIGIFEMKQNGLEEVDNPSQIFLEERPKNTSGSVVTAIMEGSRPLLVEVQALVSFSKMAAPRRMATGLDYNRVAMIAAVLERVLNLSLGNQDIYASVAGGVRVSEPAADLAIALAIVSCYRKKPVTEGLIVTGEVGLTGEIRGVNQIGQRINEAEKLGFNSIILPRTNLKETNDKKKIELIAVSDLKTALELALK